MVSTEARTFQLFPARVPNNYANEKVHLPLGPLCSNLKKRYVFPENNELKTPNKLWPVGGLCERSDLLPTIMHGNCRSLKHSLWRWWGYRKKEVASRTLALIETAVISTAMSSAKGFNVEIGFTRRLLRGTGIYPDPNGFRSFISRVYFLVPVAFLLCFGNFPQSVALKRVWGDFSTVLRLLTLNDVPYGMTVCKHIGLRYNADVLGQLVLSMSDDWNSSKTKKELKVMWKTAKVGRILSIALFSLTTGSAITYSVTGLVARRNEIKRQIEKNSTNIFRPLYIDGDFFYEVQKSPQYEITYFFQFVSMLYASTIFSGIDAFFAVLVLHLCGQLNNLKENLKSLSSVSALNEEAYAVTLAGVIARHNDLDKFAKSIEDAFNVMFLVQMIASSMVLCLQGYQLVTIITASDGIPLFELVFMLYFTLCFMFSPFVYCYIAEILRKESMEIGDVAYEIDWYNLPTPKAKLVMMFILRARQPFHISAGKFVHFSLELYCKILKSSGGYLSMLLAMKDRLPIPDEVSAEIE